ncbi:hypothetical protein J6X15_03520 [Candidatus Saccharibacteria bacterium]|nr:hypothetical protein [Candidatus Saccharibacteria bacterium]
MAKKTKAKFGKGLIVVVILFLLTLAAGIASVVLLSHNTSIVHLFGGIDNVYESAHLEKMSINGYRIGEKVDPKIKEYQVIDADFKYYYDEVAFWEKDDVVTGIGFYTFDYNLVTDITKSNIRYEGRRLATLDDFEETFGIGEEKVEKDNKTVIYRQGDYSLTIEIYKDVIQNVILLRNEE